MHAHADRPHICAKHQHQNTRTHTQTRAQSHAHAYDKRALHKRNERGVGLRTMFSARRSSPNWACVEVFRFCYNARSFFVRRARARACARACEARSCSHAQTLSLSSTVRAEAGTLGTPSGLVRPPVHLHPSPFNYELYTFEHGTTSFIILAQWNRSGDWREREFDWWSDWA